jgi:hypothetical protein
MTYLVKGMQRLLLIILLSPALSFSQMNIETPLGFEKIHVNMSTAALTAEMGSPKEIRSFRDEEKLWLDGGYNTEQSMAFVIGFDYVYIFDYQNKYCLWKAYIKDDQVIYMNLSSRYTEAKFVEAVTVRNKIHFHDSIDEIEGVLGENFFPDRNFGYTDYLYHDLGIRFTFKQNRMTNIYLFRPLNNRADLLRVVKFFPKD